MLNYYFWEDGDDSRNISTTKAKQGPMTFTSILHKDNQVDRNILPFSSQLGTHRPLDEKDSRHNIEDCFDKDVFPACTAVKKQIGFRDITKRVGRYHGTMNNEGFFLFRETGRLPSYHLKARRQVERIPSNVSETALK